MEITAIAEMLLPPLPASFASQGRGPHVVFIPLTSRGDRPLSAFSFALINRWKPNPHLQIQTPSPAV